MAGSVVASVCLALMFPLLYLFIDLLASQGRVPTYTSVPARSQQNFREEWTTTLSQDSEIAERLLQIRPVPPATTTTSPWEWDARWQATNSVYLQHKVGPEAAEWYHPLDRTGSNSTADTHDEFGLLSLALRERSHWTGNLVAWLASWNTWAWKPTLAGSANRAISAGRWLAKG